MPSSALIRLLRSRQVKAPANPARLATTRQIGRASLSVHPAHDAQAVSSVFKAPSLSTFKLAGAGVAAGVAAGAGAAAAVLCLTMCGLF